VTGTEWKNEKPKKTDNKGTAARTVSDSSKQPSEINRQQRPRRTAAKKSELKKPKKKIALPKTSVKETLKENQTPLKASVQNKPKYFSHEIFSYFSIFEPYLKRRRCEEDRKRNLLGINRSPAKKLSTNQFESTSPGVSKKRYKILKTLFNPQKEDLKKVINRSKRQAAAARVHYMVR
jgi:hypothetical protein